MSADIMNLVQGHGATEIEPHFLKWHIIWRMRGENLFGISLRTTLPRFSFCYYGVEYFEEQYPQYNFTFYNQYFEPRSDYVA